MNSLSELNNYSAENTITFQDDRPTTYDFENNNPGNTNISVYRYQDFQHSCALGDLQKIFSFTDMLSYSIVANVSYISNVSWSSLPANVINYSSSQTYMVGNIDRPTQFNAIKEPVIIMSTSGYANTWSYLTSATFNGGNSKSWTTTVTVNSLDQLTTPQNYYYPTDAPNVIIRGPQVSNLGNVSLNNDLYQLTLRSNNNSAFGNLTSSGTLGGTTSFASNTLTISGNISQVNSHLSTIQFWPANDFISPWTATYQLTNSSKKNYVSTVSQSMLNSGNAFLYSPTSWQYDNNMLTKVTGYATINDEFGNAAGSYILNIRSTYSGNLTSYGATAAVSGNNSSWLVFTGNKAAINSSLSELWFKNTLDSNSGSIVYEVVTPSLDAASKTQTISMSTRLTAVSNIADITDRTYTVNATSQVFQYSIPQILEDVTGASYSVTLTSSIGKFGISDATKVASYTFTGNKSTINSTFSQLNFYPNINTGGVQSFGYTQTRTVGASTVTQLSQSVPYFGIPNAAAEATFIITTSGTTTISYDQANYMYADVLVVGGGAGIAHTNDDSFDPSTNQMGAGRAMGGAPGGDVVFASNLILGNTSVVVSIGNGGAKASTGGNLISDNGTSVYVRNGNPGGTTTMTFGGGSRALIAAGGGSIPGSWYTAPLGTHANQFGGKGGTLTIGEYGTPTTRKNGGYYRDAGWANYGVYDGDSTFPPYDPGFTNIGTGGASCMSIGGNVNTEALTIYGANGAPGYPSTIQGNGTVYYAGGGGGQFMDVWTTTPVTPWPKSGNYYFAAAGSPNQGYGYTYGTGGSGRDYGGDNVSGGGAGRQGVVIIKFHT